MTENDEWEHSALFYVVDALDHICEKLGLVKLSSFLDWTDFEINIAMQEIARTNQNPKDEWRREAPPLIFWVLCPKQNLHCYMSEDSEDEEFPDEDTLRDKVS
ncbi:MAG: hypothetical protein ACK5Z3_01300 [Pseudanabaena sp.]